MRTLDFAMIGRWVGHWPRGVFAHDAIGKAAPVNGELALGVATVAAPWLLMQPAMGAGIAASRTPSPAKNRVRSLVNHAVFGLGLYLAALLLAWISR